jgi:hypothetical protein
VNTRHDGATAGVYGGEVFSDIAHVDPVEEGDAEVEQDVAGHHQEALDADNLQCQNDTFLERSHQVFQGAFWSRTAKILSSQCRTKRPGKFALSITNCIFTPPDF